MCLSSVSQSVWFSINSSLCLRASAEKTSPFDIYIQIIDGAAELFIMDKKYLLNPGEGIVIPAHSAHKFNAKERFKMLSTIIKSGYEE